MKAALLILPVLIPLVTAILAFCLSRQVAWQRIIALAGVIFFLGAAAALFAKTWQEGVLAIQIGSWPAPFGITFVADILSALLVVTSGIVALAVAIYSVADINEVRRSLNYHPMFHVLLAGVNGTFLTGDLFNLYVWFEVMLVASFVLMALGGGKRQLRGALKYVAINLISSAMFLTAVGILYGLTGTLNLADLAEKIPDLSRRNAVNSVAMLFLVAFGVKAAVFPFFFWLPASYHTPPVAISALFAGLLTKAGVYALIRMFTLAFPLNTIHLQNLLLALAAGTMLTGALGALAHHELRRIFSFQIIAHIGAMVMGLGFFTIPALAGAIFYLLHSMLVKTNLFLVSGIIECVGGSSDLRKLGNLANNRVASCLYLIPALALAGIPPLSGFFGEIALLRAGIADGWWWMVAILLILILLTLASVTIIWREAFWKPQSVEDSSNFEKCASGWRWRVWSSVGLSVAIAMTGLGAGVVMAVSTRAAGQLLDRESYIRAVLGDST